MHDQSGTFMGASVGCFIRTTLINQTALTCSFASHPELATTHMMIARLMRGRLLPADEH